MRLTRFLDKNLFSPPYRLLPAAVFIFVALAFAYHPQSPFYTLRLNDPDDYMRLNEVVNWLSGQGWYDLSHPRLSPGAHTVLHWSRLVDLPIALIAWPFIGIFGIPGAAMTASFLVPLILMALLFTLLPALAEPVTGKEYAKFTCLFALFAPMLLFNFTPGRVDHHNWEILIAGVGLLCLERMTRDKNGHVFAGLAAIAFACGLWIGTEALPWVILFIATLGLAGAWRSGVILRNGAVFGAALMLATACILPAALPRTEWHNLALSWFSLADVIFAVLSGGVLIASWALGRMTKNRGLRLALVAALGFSAAMFFFYLVPEALQGPFADFDDFNSTIALENIAEATPLAAAFHIDAYNHLTWMRALWAFLRFLFVPLLALGGIGFNIARARDEKRMIWIFHGVFLLAACGLTIFWQVRIGWFLQLFTLAPLTWLAFAWSKKIGGKKKDRPRQLGRIGVFLLLGPLPALLPAIVAGANLYPDLILFPVGHDDSTCNLKRAAEFIASPFGHYTQRGITILSGANEGPELLFRTPDNVIAANFNVPANRDVFDFFNARDDQTAIRVARKWKANLVLTCRSTPPFYAGMDHPRIGKNAFLARGADGKLHLFSNLDHPALIEKLVNGPIPGWLKPVEIPQANDYLLFEVHLPPAKLKTTGNHDPQTLRN